MAWDEIKERGGLAVITGGASGVGYAAAVHLAETGFDILLADRDAKALEAAAKALEAIGRSITTQVTDVSDPSAVQRLADRAFELGEVAVLMNNAGIAIPSTAWDQPEAWRKIFDVNLFGVVNGLQAFVPRMIEAGRPAAIVQTGSKQGITNPPGNPAYNASKAAVKVLSEQLAHELREAGAPIDVHLFVPGFTYTGMIASFMPEQPPGAWSSEQAVSYLFGKIAEGAFYVMCPDNMVTEDIDARRVLWSAGDIAEGRPALSRWHPEWADVFAKFEKKS